MGVGPVLVGTDFSDTAASAYWEARRLAGLMGTDVSLVHVVDGVAAPGWGEAGEAREWLRRAGIEPESVVVRFGSPWVELARYADELTPPLMVLGSHGRSGYQPLSLGSTASRLTLQSRVPVVLVSPRSSGADAPEQEFRYERASGPNPVAAARV